MRAIIILLCTGPTKYSLRPRTITKAGRSKKYAPYLRLFSEHKAENQEQFERVAIGYFSPLFAVHPTPKARCSLAAGLWRLFLWFDVNQKVDLPGCRLLFHLGDSLCKGIVPVRLDIIAKF